MTTRKDFLFGGVSAAAGWMLGGCRTLEASGRADLRCAFDGVHAVKIVSPRVTEPLRIRFIADTHLALADERDAANAGFYARMAKGAADPKVFEKTLPKAGDCDLLVLGGDIISFPTQANVDYVKARLDALPVPYAYVAGNHDWHFEGDGGSDMEQRERWILRRLKPLYGGRDPLISVVRVKGMTIVLLDNSVYHITPEQLAFFQRAAARGEPMLLFAHIPFWQPGWSVCTCGAPQWGAAHDPYWKIERRERWAEQLMPSTHAFRAAMLAAPNLLGVFTGHEHRLQTSVDHGCPQFVVPANRRGAYFDISVERAHL